MLDTYLAINILLSSLFVSAYSCGAKINLQSVGARRRIGKKGLLGEEQPDSFCQYDLAAGFSLPFKHLTRTDRELSPISPRSN